MDKSASSPTVGNEPPDDALGSAVSLWAPTAWVGTGLGFAPPVPSLGRALPPALVPTPATSARQSNCECVLLCNVPC